MPLYEYKCHSCGKIIEVIQKFSDEPLHTHEDCGGELEKLISRSAFQLKGSGWYATDYAKGNGGGTKSEDSKSNEQKNDKKSDSAKTEPSGSESKPSESKSGESKTSESKPAPAASTSETKS